MKLPKKMLVGMLVMGAVWTLPSIAVQGETAAPAGEIRSELSPGAVEILKLVQAGMEREVLLGFIGNSTNLFNLDADDLIYLQSNGVPSEITAAMLHRDQALREAVASSQAASGPQTPANTLAGQPGTTTIPTINNTQPAVMQFHASLAPYGAWFQLPEYDWVWQPKEAATNADWRPYVDGGRWAWTDHGWYWASDYPWGWAAFHYGRWLQMEKLGWVWIPDTVWAPSWVTWRHHEDNVGWAPLPPNALADNTAVVQPVVNDYDYGLPQQSYTFVNVRYVFVHNVRPHCLPPRRVNEFYKHCKVVNDYAPGRDRGVVNRGYPIARVSAATGRHLTPVPVFHGGSDRRGRDRSIGITPVQPFHRDAPHTKPPGFAAAEQPGNRSVPRSSSPTFTLPAAPRTPAAPGTPQHRGNETRHGGTPPTGVVATPMNPIVPPINPIVPPVNQAVPSGRDRDRRDDRAKPITPVVPFHPAHPNRSAHPIHGDRHSNTERNGHRSYRTPAAVPAQPAPGLAPSRSAAPAKGSWAIAVPFEQEKHQQRRSRN